MELLDGLASKDVHVRADVGRQLSKVGVPAQIPRLLAAALGDPSPGVRLYAVGAVADILSRHRVGPAAAAVTREQRELILSRISPVDPGVNAGLFSIMAVLGLPGMTRRILVGLQDPRLDVRTGAIVGLYRYFVSAEAAGDDASRQEVLRLLQNERLRLDARSAIARLAAQCGWLEAVPLLESMRGREDQLAETATWALGVLADAESLDGIWLGYGADAGEVLADPQPKAFLVVSQGSATRLEGAAIREVALSPHRRLFVSPPGLTTPVPALQIGLDTWFRGEGKAAVPAAEAFVESAAALPAALRDTVADALLAGLPTTQDRLSAEVELAAGRPQAAIERIRARKKAPTFDHLLVLGDALAAVGQIAEAQEAWRGFLEKAPKKHPRRAELEAKAK